MPCTRRHPRVGWGVRAVQPSGPGPLLFFFLRPADPGSARSPPETVVPRFVFPAPAPEIRARLDADLDQVGSVAMHRRLAATDPAAAGKIIPSNGRRVVRALEVIELTGRPYTASLPEQTYFYADAVQVGVDI